MFAILDKAKPDTESMRDINLAVVRRMTFQVIKLVLQTELPWTKRGQIYVLYICELYIYYAVIYKLIRQTQCPGV
jgi:hypothetical protein